MEEIDVVVNVRLCSVDGRVVEVKSFIKRRFREIRCLFNCEKKR